MGELVIRNMDDEIIERLKAKAAAQHQSLEQALCEILIGAVRPSREELVAEADAICKLFSPPPGICQRKIVNWQKVCRRRDIFVGPGTAICGSW